MGSDMPIRNINIVRPLNQSPRRKQTRRDDQSFEDGFEHEHPEEEDAQEEQEKTVHHAPPALHHSSAHPAIADTLEPPPHPQTAAHPHPAPEREDEEDHTGEVIDVEA